MNSNSAIRIVTFCFLIIHGLTFLAPFELFSLGTKGYEVGDLGITVFLLYSFKRLIWNGDRLRYLHLPMLVILVLLLITCLLSGIAPISSSNYFYLIQYVKSSLHFVYLVLFTIISVGIILPLDKVLLIVRTFIISSLVVNLFAIYQTPARAFDWPFANLEIKNSSLNYRNAMRTEDQQQLSLSFEGFFRATSFFSEPSALASFDMMVLCFLITPYMLQNIRIINNKFLFYLILYSTFIGLFLTFSLTAVFQLVVFIALLLLVSKGKKILQVASFAFTILVLIVITDSYVESYADISVLSLYKQRIFSVLHLGGPSVEEISGESFGERSSFIKGAIQIWGKRPVWGTGIGCLQFVKTPEGEVIVFSTSGFSEAFGVMGILGGLAFLALHIYMLLIAYRTYVNFKNLNDKDINCIQTIVPFFSALLFASSISGNTVIDTFHYAKIALFQFMINALYVGKRSEVLNLSLYKLFTPIQLLYMNIKKVKHELD